MQSPTTLEQRLFAGDQAKLVLENEAFVAAFDAVEEEVTRQWKSSPARDQDGREKLWQYLMMLHKVKAHLTTTLDTGRLAQIELQHRQTLREKAGGWLSQIV